MKQYVLLSLAALLLLTTAAQAEPPFPDVQLVGKLTQEQQAYLGVSGDTIKFSDIKGEYVFVEAFSMYCPICQRDAPSVNELYDAVRKADPDTTIKFVGLALGNTEFETAFYQKKFGVEFPLFKDEDYTIHKALGEVGTPTFYLVRIGDGSLDVLYKYIGEVKDKKALLALILDKTGLK